MREARHNPEELLLDAARGPRPLRPPRPTPLARPGAALRPVEPGPAPTPPGANARPTAAPVPAAPSARPDGGREHHLAALRSVLMILGVFLHASYLHATGKAWLVRDGDTSRILLWVNEIIHAFRIPAFFILSGFFARMLLGKQGRRGFLRSRLQRLGIPLLSTAVLLNTLQSWLLHRGADPAERSGGWDVAAFLATGEWVGHLWFLVDALAFSIAAAGLGALAAVWIRFARPKVRRGTLELLDREPGRMRRLGQTLLDNGAFLLVLPLSAFPALAASMALPALHLSWGGLSGFSLLHWFPYFAFGLLLYRHRGVRAAFQRFRPWQALSLPAALGLGAALDAAGDAAWARAGVFYLQDYVVWTLCAGLFAGLRRLLHRKSALFAYLSEASYSIYLLHHVAVVALGLAFRNVGWEPHVEFALVVAASLGFSLASHHYVILRWRPARLLFMGK